LLLLGVLVSALTTARSSQTPGLAVSISIGSQDGDGDAIKQRFYASQT